MRIVRVLGELPPAPGKGKSLQDSFQSCIQNGQICLHCEVRKQSRFLISEKLPWCNAKSSSIYPWGSRTHTFVRCSNQRPAKRYRATTLAWPNTTYFTHAPHGTNQEPPLCAFKGKFRASELATLLFPASLQWANITQLPSCPPTELPLWAGALDVKHTNV